MKKLLVWMLLMALFCAVSSAGCGGGSDGGSASDESGQTESFDEEQGTDEGRGGSGENSGTVSVHIDTASAWRANEMNFYGRKSNGEWERLKHWHRRETYDTTGNKDFTVSKNYVAFGFEVDVEDGTNWPYTGMFWEDDGHGAPDKIEIDLAGTSYNASIEIKVDGLQKYYDSNASEHTQYGWNNMRIKFFKGDKYNYKSAAFYARKTASASWVKLVDFNDNDEPGNVHSDLQAVENTSYEYFMSRDLYAEYGFEFDVLAGTNWPYSDVFWTEADSQREKVDTIYIDVEGYVRTPEITIEVNSRKVAGGMNLPAGVQRDWSRTGDDIRVRLYKTGLYSNKSRAFYARKSGGLWERLFDTADGDHAIYISSEYVEFGFEFDISSGTDWPYSDVFWTEADSAKEKVRDIYIYTGGGSLNASIQIKVNNKQKVYVDDCSSHSHHYWKTSNTIKVSISDRGSYTTKERNFYARKAGGGWERHSQNSGTFYVSDDYVDFGFEFDISSGTYWPYSGVFWTASNGEAGEIIIEVGGGVRTATIDIYVNGNKIFHDGNCDGHSQYSW